MTAPVQPGRGRGRPPRLSREAIVAAAARQGLRDLNLHALARELGVAHSALYRWVGSRDELAALINDRVITRIIPAGPVRGDDWRGWLRELGETMRREFLAVPGYASQIVGPHDHSPAFDRLRRTVVDELVRVAGATEDEAIQSFYVFATSVTGWLALEQERETPLDPVPRFAALLEVLLRGLPVAADALQR